MRYALFVFAFLPLSACVIAPSYQFIDGGERVNQPGVSFVLPTGKSWSAIIRTTYQAAFGALKMPKNETLIVAAQVYNIPSVSSPEEFLALVKEGRSSGPDTGRFEILRNSEQLYTARPETCVIHKSASKDFGAKAKRGGQYSVLETYGMNCIHPIKPAVAILVGLSRKAPPNTTFAGFSAMASQLLESVKFTEF